MSPKKVVAMLVPLAGQEASWPEAFPLTEAEFFIGRLPGSAIMSTNDSVSRQHARLVFYQDAWYIEDLGSRNGTNVEGQAVTSTILGDDQIIQTGDLWFGFTLRDPEQFDADSFASWAAEMRQKAGRIEQQAAAEPPAQVPQALPKPPAAILSNTMSLAVSPATRAYPPREPKKNAKVSAILHLPGATSATVSASASAVQEAKPVLVPSSSTAAPSSLKVTGPDYLWYAVIVLAVVGLILAVVVFVVRHNNRDSDSGSIFQPRSPQYLVAQQSHGTVR
ncbi:MAG: FHA domain-containing protein [Candidatus Methylacidiphilales bacterium]|nr:FHA domain-containing protein [Candidatus Methylacidiphilales bacterium]